MAAKNETKVRGGAKATIDHDEIRRWVESHGGRPAIVKRTRGNQGGIIRVDFPGYSGAKSLEPIDWDEWFDRLEKSNLAFLYQDETGSGRPSRFNKLVGRETVELTAGPRRSPKRSVPRRWAKKGARTRTELDRAERGSSRRTAAQPAGRARGASEGRTSKRSSAAASERGTARSRPRSTGTRSTSKRSGGRA